MEPKLIVVGGGVRSGKSRFAVSLADQLGTQRLFVATAQALDAEMRERSARHRAERGDRYTTREEPYDVPAVLAQATDVDVVVIDCLTLWLSNLLLRDETASDASILRPVDELVAATRRGTAHVIVVTNEVGCGVVPESALGRRFRDLAGAAHQRLAAASDEVYFGALGLILQLTPGPVTVAGSAEERGAPPAPPPTTGSA